MPEPTSGTLLKFSIPEISLLQLDSSRLQEAFPAGSVLAGSLLAGADCAGALVAGVAGAVAGTPSGLGASASADAA